MPEAISRNIARAEKARIVAILYSPLILLSWGVEALDSLLLGNWTTPRIVYLMYM
jgi:hypothetical protein